VTACSATHRAIDAVWRIESARVIAGLARIVGDIGLAEELAQDALVAALEQWPESGVPRNPGAWLTAIAKHRAIDHFRRRVRLERKINELGHELETGEAGTVPDFDTAVDDDIGDDLLRLVFTACHPVLPTEARVALTLRLLGGLKTDEIARAFLVSESTVAQRIVRAKRTLAQARVPFEVPQGAERATRLSSVLEVLYLIFNEGYTATSGEDWIQPAMCEEGARWDQLLIHRGLSAVERSAELDGQPGPYAVQAMIAACHARATTAEQTDWIRIAALYEVLGQLAPSPVVELNRAVAVAMAFGPAAGLGLVDALTSEPSLAGYHLLPSVRGDFLAKLGRREEARAEFERAASLTRNAPERTLLLKRAAECVPEATRSR
jgi:RNA polymerase sigma factor (sigma-70 family)